jgi:hypothetical protein
MLSPQLFRHDGINMMAEAATWSMTAPVRMTWTNDAEEIHDLENPGSLCHVELNQSEVCHEPA